MTFLRLSISVLVLAACVPAWATTIVYCGNSTDCGTNDQTAFNNAADSPSPILFTAAGFIDDGYEYADPSGTDFFSYQNSSDNGFNNYYSSGTGPLEAVAQGDAIEVTLPANVYAFGTNLQGTSVLASLCIEPIAEGTCTYSLTPSTSSEFIGVVSTSPLSTVWIVPYTGSKLTLSNFEIEIGQQSQVSDTPEVATMIMIGAGLISLGVMRRRRSI